ncbi:MAG: hypothetical protein JSW34_07430 [Candidatus Zixiibacteriota bacterium]|nr:MAG: hypothetical protein JSW34_07430 [candidate division Zixibacteria bacterium]
MKKLIACRLMPAALLTMIASGPSYAGVATTFDMPDTGYISNVVIDIVEHNGGVWLVTSEGLNFSFDDGETWLSYDETNGLVSSSISAMLSIPIDGGDRIWIASSHEETIGDDIYRMSDGVSYSDDGGDLWTQIIFDSSGLNIPFVWGGDRTIYDITGHFDDADAADNWLFFTAFAGGFLASRDGGMSWRRIFPSVTDSIQFNDPLQFPSLRNRYFSCAADTSHGDSLFVWAGTAEGFFQYIFAAPGDKAYSEKISRIAFCETCGADDSNFVYFGGDAGFMRSIKPGGPFISRFEEDGLPGQSITSLIDFGGKIFAGTIDPSDSSSTGLAESVDFGESFAASPSFTETGPGKRILDFAAMGDRLYMAVEEAGLYVTRDTGQIWTPVAVDAPDLAAGNRRNVVHALNTWGDTLRLGTDSGLVNLFLDPNGVVDSSRFFVYAESDTSGSRVVRVKTHRFASTDVIWTINRAVTPAGIDMVSRSADGGLTYTSLQRATLSNDINFFGDTTFVVGEAGIRFSPDGSNPGQQDDWIVYIRDFVGETAVDSLINDRLTVMEVLGDTVYIGTDSGFAVSLDRGETYDIRRINRDSLKADGILQYTREVDGLTGNFIPALEVQHLPDTLARVWASNRRTYEGTEGISVGRIDLATRIVVDTVTDDTTVDSVYIYNWDNVYGQFAWNFAFNGDTVFAATDSGLIYTWGDNIFLGQWDTLELRDDSGNPLLLPGTPTYAARVVGDFLWVGTGDRTVRADLATLTGQIPFSVIDPADEVYAFPVPFSQSLDRFLEFHFLVHSDAYITLEIYDFAMNLVRRVVDNEFFPAGVSTTQPVRRPWDGLNGRGDIVAVGVYYFKVEYSTGEVRWGKLAVIP